MQSLNLTLTLFEIFFLIKVSAKLKKQNYFTIY